MKIRALFVSVIDNVFAEAIINVQARYNLYIHAEGIE
jgi:hypothetical protein